MSAPVVVVHVLSRLNRGGAELRTLDAFRALQGRGYDLHLILASGQRGTLDDDFRAAGVTLHYQRLDASFPLAFQRLLRALHPVAVHSHLLLTSGPILLLARLAGVPVRVAQFRSAGDGRANTPMRRLSRWARRWMLDRSATRIVGVSAAALEGTWGAGWRSDPRASICYVGIPRPRDLGPSRREELRRECGAEVGELLVLHIGRFHKSKDQPFVARVVGELHRRGHAVRLAYVGRPDTAEFPRTQGEVAREGISSITRFLGERSDAGDLLQAADLLLFPSRWEGLPGSVVESLAAGTPVVGSDIPALAEIAGLLPGVTTLSKEAPVAAWADAVDRAGRGTDADRAVRREAFAHSLFSMDRSVDALRALWVTS